MKAIEFNYNGVDYKLCYTIASIVELESRGFDVKALSDNNPEMFDTIALLIHGAFFAKHPDVELSQALEIYENLDGASDGNKLFETLVNMYGEAVSNLAGEKTGKVKWVVRG